MDRPATDPRLELRADCARCFGLCCVVPAFAASADFAIDKPAGTPCPNLQGDFACGIHRALRTEGFPGCTVYDCFGAGQHVAQVTFAGRDWRSAPEGRDEMFAAFPVVRELHELRWYLADALDRVEAAVLHPELRRARAEVERLGRLDGAALAVLDVSALRRTVGDQLAAVSDLVRGEAGRAGADHRGADLVGARLRSTDLRGATFRAAYLLGADLRGADLRFADLLGADLRGAKLAGADLTDALFLTAFQLAGATGDRTTVLPPALDRPAHWSASP
ncbi:pentapeptide repeat-containing protein [Aquihabitans sp. G128]|uniref:pentapeptide repeat-containing protein n=1 Tax=Aquihabitans sp. G128 TaxID=2849779 RepID=UPI001C210CF1|nr:pentapeptide repeat-containing protein [Aquihabitans sp. G128]QXC59692.1 pentapeptide repeat-containing protein [Aquihabitans sp. G128]